MIIFHCVFFMFRMCTLFSIAAFNVRRYSIYTNTVKKICYSRPYLRSFFSSTNILRYTLFYLFLYSGQGLNLKLHQSMPITLTGCKVKLVGEKIANSFSLALCRLYSGNYSRYLQIGLWVMYWTSFPSEECMVSRLYMEKSLDLWTKFQAVYKYSS